MDNEENKIRALIVDDIADVRMRIYNILKDEQDIEVVGFASNGKEAIEEYERLVPDVMTTCICMPVMNGIEASEKIISNHPDAIIIIISVQNEPDYMRRAMLAGVRDFLQKPVEKHELLSAIRKYYYWMKGNTASNNLTIIEKQGFPDLVKNLRENKDIFTRVMTLKTLSNYGINAIDPLIQALNDPDTNVRMESQISIAKIGFPAIDPLVRKLKDNDKYLRKIVIETLIFILASKVTEPLILALENSW